MGANPLAAALAAEAADVGVVLTDAQLAAFVRYLQLIVTWSSRARLTALTDPRQIVRLHFVDSLVCLRVPFPSAAAVIDVGSGAGLPGIPLAIARPKYQVTLLEPNARKAAFLELAVGELRLRCRVVCDRAEVAGHTSELREQFDVAVARAVAPLAQVTEWTLPFVRVGGAAILLKGPAVAEELSSSAEAIAALGGEAPGIVSVELAGGERRAIVTVRKVSSTPAIYPRRASGRSRRQ